MFFKTKSNGVLGSEEQRVAKKIKDLEENFENMDLNERQAQQMLGAIYKLQGILLDSAYRRRNGGTM